MDKISMDKIRLNAIIKVFLKETFQSGEIISYTLN